MLELKNIKKVYELGKPKDKNYQTVVALNNISIQFRDTEFVSILGPSGCGKTTLLNIVGGLDHYTSGDLIINGISTREYKDKDWDNYRNHKIGFVFQSYNLIPHQTVLENVELALTLSGVNKEERKRKAIDALIKVGLEEKINAKPTQLSGGQMQRVAIARAIVNDPDIILADEPTGALDTHTSVQIMELLKEISQEKLIIMVTHNPELAEKYSTRIVRLLDGNITDDTCPFNHKDVPPTFDEVKKQEKKEKTSMSFFTALSLSARNLWTKKGRTALVSFAGSIGIIGISLILSLSSGFQNYINEVQQDTLSSYPLTIQAESVNYMSAITTIMNPNVNGGEGEDDGNLDPNYIMSEIFETVLNASSVNDLKTFKSYIEENPEKFEDYTIQYGYNLGLDVYNENAVKLNPMTIFTDLIRKIGEKYNQTPQGQESPINYEMYINRFNLLDTEVFSEMIDNQKLLESQYELIGTEYGSKWPSNYNECVLVVNENYTINDYNLYALDIVSEPTLDEIADGLLDNFLNKDDPNHNDYEVNIEDIPYEEILNKEYNIILESDYFTKNSDGKTFYDIREKVTANQLIKDKIEDGAGIDLKIVGIIKPKENATAASITTPIGYLPSLTKEIITRNNNSEVAIAQKNNPDYDVLTGDSFKELTVDEMKTEIINKINSYSDDEILALLKANEEISSSLQQMGVDVNNPTQVRATLVSIIKSGFVSDEQIKQIYELMLTKNTYSGNLQKFGCADKNSPSSISFYCSDFEAKDGLIAEIDAYNNFVKNDPNYGDKYIISYTDYAGMMMSSVSLIISAISYVLIAFVSVSLIVSSIMIGIITYISVLERTKEIGILRSIGASKKDIKNVFTAETLIIGLISGVFGICVTLILNIPISLIISSVANISNVAVLPVLGAIILILLSCILTFIAGLFPSNIASKKDPVIALRSE